MAFAGIGEILEPSLQGFATFVTNSTHNALLFTSVATCHSLANLIGGPVNSYLMTLGRRPGHQDTGIVFLGAMVTSNLTYQLSSPKLTGADYVLRVVCLGMFIAIDGDSASCS